jgi:hypothetical protein
MVSVARSRRSPDVPGIPQTAHLAESPRKRTAGPRIKALPDLTEPAPGRDVVGRPNPVLPAILDPFAREAAPAVMIRLAPTEWADGRSPAPTLVDRGRFPYPGAVSRHAEDLCVNPNEVVMAAFSRWRPGTNGETAGAPTRPPGRDKPPLAPLYNARGIPPVPPDREARERDEGQNP